MDTPEDLEDLVDLRIPREERHPLTSHLCEDTAYRPHIYGSRVVPRAQQYFRRSVPKGDNLALQSAGEHEWIRSLLTSCV
jgi:hypothetical protein